MLHTFLFPPFPDPARQAQFEAVQAALAAEPEAPVSLLLGNFAVAVGGAQYDAVLIRPHSVTVLLFVAGGGLLDISPAAPGIWQLDGQALRMASTASNPFGQFRRLKEGLADWLVSQLGPGQVAPELITGLVLFAAPITFGLGVEQFLRTQPGADSLQLLADVGQLTRRLQQLAHPEIQLSDNDLQHWAHDLAAEHPASLEAATFDDEDEQTDPEQAGFWELKARQLWRWLGAEDVPHDAPYGSAAAAVAASSEEKQHLEHLRQQIRMELDQQRQQTEAREAEREQSIALLRAQLAAAPIAAPNSAALELRLAAETREKAVLEAAVHTARIEAAARNQELDVRIQQLSQLIEQFQARPVLPAPAPTPASGATTPKRPAARNAGLFRRPSTRLHPPRVALVVAAAAGLALSVWGLTQLNREPARTENSTRYSSANDSGQDQTTIQEDATDARLDSLNQVAATAPESAADSTTQPAEATDTPNDLSETLDSETQATHDTIRLAPETFAPVDSSSNLTE